LHPLESAAFSRRTPTPDIDAALMEARSTSFAMLRQSEPAARQAELLPVPYYHLVFTLPGPIADIGYHNKAVVTSSCSRPRHKR
jgi:hypothetical protein